MKQRWIVRFFGVALIILIVIAGFGQAVLQLWNRLMPQIFGLPFITFWQAVGLLALSWILFGGWRGAGGFRRRFSSRENWRRMTPEQREKLRKAMASRCRQPEVPGTL